MPAAAINGLPADAAGPVVTVVGGDTLQVNAATGDWNLFAATVVGGTIATSDGAGLVIHGGTLDGVTLNSDFSLPNSAGFQARHGLTVNGKLTINANDNVEIDTVDPTESLSGSGQVILNGGSLQITASGPAKIAVIAQGMVVHGAGDFSATSGVTLENEGTVEADVPGGMLRCYELRNDGTTAISAGSSIGVVGYAQYNGGNDLTLNSDGALNVEIGGTDPSLFGQIKAYFPSGNSAIVGLGGALNISFVNGFQPALGDSFKVIDVT